MTKIHLLSNNISKKTSLIDKQEHLKKERYVFLDILKIIAMMCVIYYHSNARSILPSEIYNFIAGFLSSCIPIFFMVNGALLLNKDMDLKKHVRKTIKSLWLTVLWSFIIIIAVIPILGFEDFSIVNFIKGVFVNKHGYSHYLWFMVQLTIIYLIFPLIKYLFDNSKVYFVFICGFCIILAYGTSLTRTFIMCFDKLLGTGNIISEFIGFGYNFLCKFDITTKSYPFALSIFMFGGILFYYLIKNKAMSQKMTDNLKIF